MTQKCQEQKQYKNIFQCIFSRCMRTDLPSFSYSGVYRIALSHSLHFSRCYSFFHYSSRHFVAFIDLAPTHTTLLGFIAIFSLFPSTLPTEGEELYSTNPKSFSRPLSFARDAYFFTFNFVQQIPSLIQTIKVQKNLKRNCGKRARAPGHCHDQKITDGLQKNHENDGCTRFRK